MRLPTWDELIPEQLDVMEHPLDQPLFVAGPPGSGKTVLAVRRAEAASGEGKTVALVTYNRMLRRLATLLSEGSAVSRTMHKFAWQDYRTRTGTSLSTFDYDWSRMLAFLEGHPNSEATWDHVVVDEGQDLPQGFFQYLNKHAARVVTVFADDDQAVGDRRTTLEQIRAAADLPMPVLLHENHRNSPEIAALAEHFHSGRLPAATPRRAVIGQRPRLIQQTRIGDTVEFIGTWFENRGGTIGIIVSSNQTGDQIHRELSRRLPKRRIDIYNWSRSNENAIALLDEGVTILNKESVKGQEFDTVFLLELERFIPCTNDVMKRAMYMMSARARDYLFLVHQRGLVGCGDSGSAWAQYFGTRMIANQLPMDFAALPEKDDRPRREVEGPEWLGLSLDHRALFEALQDDWLRPVEGAPGHVLGVRAFAGDVQSANGHRILVRIKFDPERLPRLPVYRRRAGEWAISSITSHEADDPVVFWPGLLPTFAISELLVASDEEISRLTGLARQVSNVPLPVIPRVLRSGEDASVPWSAPPNETLTGIVLPPEMDAVRGAMAMAMWAVPRVDPWLDLLCKSLGTDPSEKLTPLAEHLRSPWWVSPPWIRISRPQPNASPQEQLWVSATRAFQSARRGSLVMAANLVNQVAADASRDLSDGDLSQVREWTLETIKVLRGDAKLDLRDWKVSPVGKAIQLVLVRPDPSVFTKWKDDLPSLPPAVWWSAAALCGLLNGYRRLPNPLRGEAEQQRLFAIHALRALGAEPAAENWAALVQGSPEWHRQSGDIVFSWSGTPFARKPENARGRWFSANLNDVVARKAAEEISRSNGWACIRTKVTVPAGDIPFSGGSIQVVSAPQQHLQLNGPTEFTLPLGAVIEPILDTEEFRRCIVTEGASIPPPGTQQRVARSASEKIPGLVYVPNFLTEAQEVELVAVIDKGEWSSVLKRRVQHFGWRYDYKSREINMSMRLGSLPDWAMVIAKRLKAEGLLPQLADQVIVNEYMGKQGISKHIDCVPCFDDGVAMISLLESWEMIFREKDGHACVPKLLEHRSVAVMTGDVRYRWSHEIPARNTEPSGLRRHRRVSVTFRKVNDDRVVREPRHSRKEQSV